MVSVTYSQGLQDAVRRLKQMDSQEVASLFQNTDWAQAWSLTAQEGQAVMKMLSRTTSDYIKKANVLDNWY
ncbi:hypothetical protein DVH26_05405 [Paenibacillus sp. H1-7]|uniref:hypothetical protein n=1 Tax=Paenibacillus sp. H1-7 TaxID=2282849 RepID=UPI001EF9A918|nr:hypothetical protein [Paenibacillus sp. H1-7]ULL13933.1 hypothetical protein DVH26_05405 [Paenibacillus sp. H1-7]